MTRPARPTIDNGDVAWDAPANDAHIQLYDRPAPIGELHAGTLAALDAARVPSAYDQCLAWAWFGSSAPSGLVPVINDGTNWVPVSNWIAARKRITSIDDTYTVLSPDDVILITGSNTFDLTLPTSDAGNEGREIEFKHTGTGTVTIKGTIDGVADLALVTQYDSVFLRSDGAGGYMRVGTLASTGVTIPLIVAVGDETSVITLGTGKITFRMPYGFTVTGVRASLGTASATGTVTVDINESGSTILSTKLTIDATEKTSVTAAIPAVISDSALADDAEITIDIDDAGSSADAVGLKVTILGTET